jgi:hypothetical protein
MSTKDDAQLSHETEMLVEMMSSASERARLHERVSASYPGQRKGRSVGYTVGRST